jgi:hypothetical protein
MIPARKRALSSGVISWKRSIDVPGVEAGIARLAESLVKPAPQLPSSGYVAALRLLVEGVEDERDARLTFVQLLREPLADGQLIQLSVMERLA